MPDFVRTLPHFELQSSWEVTQSWDNVKMAYVKHYSVPTTDTENATFDISGIPAGAIPTAATLAATLGTPGTGAAIRTVDGTTYYSPRDVLSRLQALNGNYASLLTFVFRFKGNGGTGDVGTHWSVLDVDNLTLTVSYIMPASTGALNLSEVDIGQTIRLQNIVAEDATYTHKAVWSLAGQGEQVQNLGANPGHTDFTLPASWLSILPAATQGAASVRLETYSAAGALLGSNTYTFTAKVGASIVPTITGQATAKVSDTTPAVPGAWNKFVKTKSKATISAAVAAGTGSSIKSIRVECAALGFVAYSLPCTTGLLTAAGAFTFTITVYDQRDRPAVQTVPITVDDYGPPSASGVLFSRALTDNGNPDPSGTYLRVIATLTGSTLGGLNPISAKAYYRQYGTSTWYPAGGKDIASGVAGWTGAGGINVAYPYDVKLEVTDAFGTIPIQTMIPTGARGWDFRADRAALGRYAAGPKTFATPIDWNWEYKGQDLDARFLKLSGGYATGKIGGLRGTYQADAGVRYVNGALEIREADAVGGAQSAIGYAPSIGFHWSGRAGGNLVMQSDGTFAFLNIVGGPAGVDVGALAATGNLSTTGMLYAYNNGKYASFGDCAYGGNHIITDGDYHYFNKKLLVLGDIFAGSAYDKMVYHQGNFQHGAGAVPSLPSNHYYVKHA